MGTPKMQSLYASNMISSILEVNNTHEISPAVQCRCMVKVCSNRFTAMVFMFRCVFGMAMGNGIQGQGYKSVLVLIYIQKILLYKESFIFIFMSVCICNVVFFIPTIFIFTNFYSGFVIIACKYFCIPWKGMQWLFEASSSKRTNIILLLLTQPPHSP